MKIAKLQVSQPATMAQLYRDFSAPELAKYRIDLAKEAPSLQQQIEALTPADRQRYATTFATTWNNLPPDARMSIVGGAAGGTAGAALALTSLSLKEISRLIGGPVGFVVGITVLGVLGGAVTPQVLQHFSKGSLKTTIRTPKVWNLVLPEAAVEFQGHTSKPAPATKPQRRKA